MEWMFLPLKRYADFSGRSRRTEYWMFVLFQFLIGIAYSLLLGLVGGAALFGGDPGALVAAGGAVMILTAIYALVCLALIIPAIAVAIRRLHDTNRTGWWVLAPLAPYCLSFIGAAMAASSPGSPGAGAMLALVGGLLALAMAVALIVFLLLDGTRGPNRFGADPKDRVPPEVFA
ncbi:MAG: hypothetical protein JWO25_3224 [Alphaproteobacteria bacterium]|nr:hypothetical protein [Alphaproteobacteria bacterium]MDB5721517.1 hypothetical protein [Alphaproteobacteria bacterium]